MSGRDVLQSAPQGTAACMRPTPLLAAPGGGALTVEPAATSGRVTPEEQAFIRTLNSELNKLNEFFMEKEVRS